MEETIDFFFHPGDIVPTKEVYEREKNTTVSFSVHTYEGDQEDSIEIKGQVGSSKLMKLMPFFLMEAKFLSKQKSNILGLFQFLKNR